MNFNDGGGNHRPQSLTREREMTRRSATGNDMAAQDVTRRGQVKQQGRPRPRSRSRSRTDEYARRFARSQVTQHAGTSSSRFAGAAGGKRSSVLFSRGRGQGGSARCPCPSTDRASLESWSQNLDRKAADSKGGSNLHSQPDRQGDHSDRADHRPARTGGPHGQGLFSRPYGIVAGRVSRGALSTTAAEDRNVRRVLCAGRCVDPTTLRPADTTYAL